MTEKKKGKQPYIPLYIGDWLQDTDCLSIEAEGAWLRVVFKCWKNKGIFTATEDVFARLCKVDTQKFASILLEWQQNDICDISPSTDGTITIVSRRIKREKEISAIKSESGSKGGSKTQAQRRAKTKQIPDIDNGIDNEDENKKEGAEKVLRKVPRGTDDSLWDAEDWTDDVLSGNDEIFTNMVKRFSLNGRLDDLARSHLGLCSRYGWHKKMDSQQAFRNSLINHITEEIKKNAPTKRGIEQTSPSPGKDYSEGF